MELGEFRTAAFVGLIVLSVVCFVLAALSQYAADKDWGRLSRTGRFLAVSRTTGIALAGLYAAVFLYNWTNAGMAVQLP